MGHKGNGKIVAGGWERARNMPDDMPRKRRLRVWVAPNVELPPEAEHPIWHAAFRWLDLHRQEQISDVQMLRGTDGRLLISLASARHNWAVLAALHNDDPNDREWLDFVTFSQLCGDMLPPNS